MLKNISTSERIASIFIAIIVGLAIGYFIAKSKGRPVVYYYDIWSIGIYEGESPFQLKPAEGVTNPVLTAESVTDVKADYVADPFVIINDGTWYMFFEVLNSESEQGDVGLATSNDGLSWKYEKIVLDATWCLSYPIVFKWQDEFYMMPETFQNESIKLYKAVNFPDQWELIGTLISGRKYVDNTTFRYHDKWWMFSSVTSCDSLFLFYADDLTGPWTEHPESPVVSGDKKISRPGGRVLNYNDEFYRFAQDDAVTYGKAVNGFKITKLSATEYKEMQLEQNPILTAAEKGWNSKGMHQYEPIKVSDNKWIVIADGVYQKIVRTFE